VRNVLGIHRFANSLFAAGSAADALRFRRGLKEVPALQTRKLLSTLQRNQDTVFGQKHGFGRIRSLEAYQSQVPVADYEAFRPYVERIADGEKRVLTREEVLLLEPTGGTSSGSKWIPYTRSLKQEFQAAVRTWIFDVFLHFPRLLSSRSYWSVTPVTGERQTKKSGIPVGFEDDSEYAGPLGKVLQKGFAVPPDVKNVRNIHNFRYITAYYLLRAGDLGLLSVWNPTFLLLLLDEIQHRVEPLARDLFDGTLRLPEPDEDRFSTRRVRPARGRARVLQSAFRKEEKYRYRDIWPGLRLISCWADGLSREHANTIRKTFPGVTVQPKGLLATECVASFPLEAAGGSVPACASHFFEFLPEAGGPPQPLHRLDEGADYTLVVTTGGGLYRYNMRDRIRVTHRWRGLPVIRFQGRIQLCDLVGEKLEEQHVQSVLDRVLASRETRPRFLLFAPELTPAGGFYTLFIEPDTPVPPAHQEAMLEEIDAGLRENFHYGYARDLGQLESPRMLALRKDTGQETYIRRCVDSGQRLGDIKQTLLDRRTGWTAVFKKVQTTGPGSGES